MINYYSYKDKNLKHFGFKNPLTSQIFKKLNGECNKMSTIRENAKAYESPKTKNIIELKEISTELDIVEKEFQDRNGETFKVSTITVNDQEYRIPNSVLRDLKAILQDKPETTKFKVTKTGEGMQTSYTVITLD